MSLWFCSRILSRLWYTLKFNFVIFQIQESADLAVHDAGHRQEGVADALLHQGILILPLQESWGAYPWVLWHWILIFCWSLIQNMAFLYFTWSILCDVPPSLAIQSIWYPTQSSSRSRKSRRLSGWTMVFACMRFFFNLNIFHWISHFQRGSSDKAVMAFTQGMLVSFQLVLRWIWRCFILKPKFFLQKLFRQLEQCSGFRLSSLWPNERNIVPTCCSCSQPSKGYVSRLSRYIGREKDNFRKDGRGRKDGDNSFWPAVPKPEPDEELLAELCRLPPMPEDQGGKMGDHGQGHYGILWMI